MSIVCSHLVMFLLQVLAEIRTTNMTIYVMASPFAKLRLCNFACHLSFSWSFWFPVLLCPRVWTSLENGRVMAKPPGPPVEGTVLHYSCHAGFILEGRNISHCTKLGKWDAPKPTCLCEYRSQCDRYFTISFLLR